MIRRAFLSAVLGVLMATAPVQGAEPSRDLTSMRVVTDAVIYVRLSNGTEVRGRFLRASAQALVIARPDGRELMLTSEQVMSVWKRGDGVRNGALIGGLVGLAGGILGQSGCTDCSAEVALGVGLGVPMWAGIGALIDRQHAGRTLIYQAP